MIRRLFCHLCLLLGLFGALGSAWAQGRWHDLPPDERRQLRQQMREHWQQMPPEDKQRFRQERQERREAFQQMAPEDRSRLRDELRGRRFEDGAEGRR
ncbi:MAG: periplasmic heavy metal sensor [Rhodocyclales bacterium GT-UBC]|nr:MAG: periplasmic heavy metal sensor [Rhodocyclales bacterium GT-UBC]